MYRVDISLFDGSENAATILVDPGSDTNYVTHNFARALGLTGTPYTWFLKVVDMEYLEKSTAHYDFDIVDREGATHHIQALGLDTITTLPDEPDLSPIEGLEKSWIILKDVWTSCWALGAPLYMGTHVRNGEISDSWSQSLAVAG